MPEEIAVIIALSLLSGTIITLVRVVLGHRERIRGLGQPSQGKLPSGSVTTSELERLMRSAVQDATAPLVERISRLEKTAGPSRPGTPAVSEGPARGGLEEISDADLEELAPTDDVVKARLKVR